MNKSTSTDNKSILAINKRTGLYILDCPFLVICMVEVKEEYMFYDCIYSATEVRYSDTNKLEYKVNDCFFPYNYFILDREVQDAE